MSEKSIESPPARSNTFGPIFIDYCPLPEVKFGGNCLGHGSIYANKYLVNLFVFYRLDTWFRDLDIDFTLGSCLFGALSQQKILILMNIDIVVMVLDLMHGHNFHC